MPGARQIDVVDAQLKNPVNELERDQNGVFEHAPFHVVLARKSQHMHEASAVQRFHDELQLRQHPRRISWLLHQLEQH